MLSAEGQAHNKPSRLGQEKSAEGDIFRLLTRVVSSLTGYQEVENPRKNPHTPVLSV